MIACPIDSQKVTTGENDRTSVIPEETEVANIPFIFCYGMENYVLATLSGLRNLTGQIHYSHLNVDMCDTQHFLLIKPFNITLWEECLSGISDIPKIQGKKILQPSKFLRH